MSNTVIENHRREKSRLDEIDARCAERTARIDRLKAEDSGRDFFQGWNLMGRSDCDNRLPTAAPGRRSGSQ